MSGDSPLVGRRLEGRYRIDRHLADGGMGSVYVAHDERLERDIAVKVLRPDLARDPAFVRRFQREAQAAARLNDPHVVAVHDQGQDGDVLFLVMELVRGHTLRDLLRDAASTFGQRLAVFDQMLAGLAAAHREGIAHRDVKPENVLLDLQGHVTVADFGLARAVAASARASNSDVLLGTASYLSPEQVETGRADERSDVYAAGLVLYEILSGQRAFSGDVPMHVAYQHVHGDVPELADTVPHALEARAIIAAATARNPAERLPDAAALRHVFDAFHRRWTREELTAPAPQERDPISASTEAAPSHTAVLKAGATRALPAPMAPHRRPTRSRRGALTALGSVAVLGIAALVARPHLSHTVPTVNGQVQGDAVARLRAAGFAVRTATIASDTVPAERAVGTNPPAGSQHWFSETVTLNMSSGPRMVLVPHVAGLSETAARARLDDVDLRVASVTRHPDRSAAGTALGLDRAAGERIRHGSALTLTVSSGPAAITVPDVTKTDGTKAVSRLHQLGLASTEQRASDDNVPSGQVISTNPSAGHVLHTGDTVTVTVSTGRQQVNLPDVTGMSASDAVSTLHDAGFSVGGVGWLDTLFDRTVSTQSPTGGGTTKVPKGTKVTLGF